MNAASLASLRLMFGFALEGLSSQRGRSLLTMLGMAIGTASVVAVISIGLVGRDYVVGLIEGVGTNLVIVYAKDEGVNPEQLLFSDVEAIGARVPHLAAMAPVLNDVQSIAVRDKPNRPKALRVLGTPPAYAAVRNLIVESGRFTTQHDETTGAKVAVISHQLALELFGSSNLRGRTLRLFDMKFRVVGVYRESVESAAAMEQSEAAGLTAIVPLSTFRNLSDTRSVFTLYLQATSREAVPRVLATVSDVLAARHPAIEGFAILSLAQYIQLVDRISDGISLGLLAIAGISLLVGGIGIMNIMLVSVSERTRDIGIRLALGARRRDILLQFLLEAGMLSLAGGTLGLLLGALLPWSIGRLNDFDLPVSLASAAIAFAVSLTVGTFFGLYPARRAASMNLVDALGYE